MLYNRNPKELIDFFDGTEFDFLSNFHPMPINWMGLVWPTSEHAFQAMKCFDAKHRERIRLAPHPGNAKALGQKHAFDAYGVEMRRDWESNKFDVMRDLLRVKFMIPAMRSKLLLTGGAELVEGNTWNDTCWGVCWGVGANHLGRLLMLVRGECALDEIAKTNPDDEEGGSAAAELANSVLPAVRF